MINSINILNFNKKLIIYIYTTNIHVEYNNYFLFFKIQDRIIIIPTKKF